MSGVWTLLAILAVASGHGRHRLAWQYSVFWNNLGRSQTGADWTPPPALCRDSSVDAVFAIRGCTFIFKGDVYYKLKDDAPVGGFPRSISRSWAGLPGHIDAAFTYGLVTFFLKGHQYWRYQGARMDAGYPRNISAGFPGVPDHVDAALVRPWDSTVYFFKGDLYWQLGRRGGPAVPRPISDWRGVPGHLDAAVTHRGRTFFFKGSQYFGYDYCTGQVDDRDPPYPRSTGYWWFQCSTDMGTTTERDGHDVTTNRPNTEHNGYDVITDREDTSPTTENNDYDVITNREASSPTTKPNGYDVTTDREDTSPTTENNDYDVITNREASSPTTEHNGYEVTTDREDTSPTMENNDYDVDIELNEVYVPRDTSDYSVFKYGRKV